MSYKHYKKIRKYGAQMHVQRDLKFDFERETIKMH